MVRRYGTSLGIGFLFFLVGILLGGCFIGSLPHHNHIQLMVTPYNAINVIPEVGDVIDWSTYGQAGSTPVSFPVTGSPCSTTTPSSRCVYQDSSPNNVYIYQCGGSTPCDPGIGPHGTTVANKSILETIFLPLGRLLDVFVVPIDRILGVLPGPPDILPASGSSSSAIPPVSPIAAAPDVQIGCDSSNHTTVIPPNITKSSGDTIFWAGPAFTVAFEDASACQGSMSTPSGFQSCKFTPPAPGKAYSYSVYESSCSATATKATITAP